MEHQPDASFVDGDPIHAAFVTCRMRKLQNALEKAARVRLS
jgi:hypothetical protein